jgi:uracil-DNA glycosylase family 4
VDQFQIRKLRHQWFGYLPKTAIQMTKKRQPQQSISARFEEATEVAELRTDHPDHPDYPDYPDYPDHRGDQKAHLQDQVSRPDGFLQGPLEELRSELQGCVKCRLSEGRKSVVVGEGNPKAQLVFVGEGPDEQDELEAKPFVGKSGQLLTKMIEAIGLAREDVFICNVIKCRPPGSRAPQSDEIKSCTSFLERQLHAIQPKVIVAFGKIAAQTLLETEERISTLRGKEFSYKEAKLIPTFHPSFLLRNPGAKRAAWEDLKKAASLLGIEVPSARRNR